MAECKTINCPTCGVSISETFVEQKCPRCQTLIESKFICGSCHNCAETIAPQEKNKPSIINRLLSIFKKK